MSPPSALRTVRWMVRDTFRQAVASKLAAVMLAVTAVCTLLCLSVGVTGDMPKTTLEYEVPAFLPKGEAEKIGPEKVKDDGVRVVSGELSLGFGLVSMPLGRNRDDAVRFLQVWLGAAVADTLGVLLALLWTAGFLPQFLEPQAASVLLAKPPSRGAILLGKYAGVVLFVALQAFLFVAATWLALGIKTGVWGGAYWLAVPLLALNFGVFYAVSAFLAVWTRGTTAAAFGTLLFWLMCWGMNLAHLKAESPNSGMPAGSRAAVAAGYWALPKPLDMGAIFFDAVGAEGISAKLPEIQAAQEAGRFHPELAVFTSILFAVGVLGLAVYEFRQADY